MDSTQRRSVAMPMLSSLTIIIIWSVLISSANGFSITHSTNAATKIYKISFINNHHNPPRNPPRNKQSQSASFTSRKIKSTVSESSIQLHLSAANDGNSSDETDNKINNQNHNHQKKKKKKKKGDSIRSKTGIRPSLHPTEINCIAEALMLRSTKNPAISIDTSQPNVEPLEVAITAGGIAMTAIDKRNSDKDDTSEKFTMEEAQTISGRVVGVVMRMTELEDLLVERVQGVGWVKKYGEEESFGVLRAECECECGGEDDDDKTKAKEEEELVKVKQQVGEMIKINPLFRMNRAECLLCLFLDTVERPKLELLGEGVAGGSEVDFIDADRLEVLLLRTENNKKE